MLEICDLVKYYGKFKAVDNLNLNIERGNIFGFVGPNGAGKTTTMRIMSGLLEASGGEVIINGIDVSKDSKLLKQKIGYMPDFFGVYDNLKVDEYMDFYADAYYTSRKERNKTIDNLLEIVNLSDKKNSYVDSLSRGMKQRLCLARSLIHDPELLILDEPASGLDPRARVEIKEVLKQLKAFGKTIIISSHILSELSEMCTRVGIIDKGKIVAEGTIGEITKKLVQNRSFTIKDLHIHEDAISRDNLIRLLDENPFVSKIIENVDEVEFSFDGEDTDFSHLVKTVVLNDIPIIAVKEKEGNLEELFMELTEGGVKA